MKKIGIIGGAGPMASCQLYKEIIIEFQRYGCKNDRDFPEIVIISYPFSGMLNAEEYATNQQAIIEELQYCFDWLYEQNVDIAIIACNTLHTLIKQIQIKIPIFVSIPDTILNCAINNGTKKLLILGTEMTNQMKLYTSKSIECITPNKNDQIIISIIINNLLAGQINKQDAKKINRLIKEYKQTAAIDGVVLACTELPLLYKQYTYTASNNLEKTMIFDSITVTAQEIMKKTLPFRPLLT
jgi:aspartate racemase